MVEDKLYRTTRKRQYNRAMADARNIVQEALSRFGEPAVVAVSGGKDSVAMAHIVAQQCRPTILWTDSGLELPGSRETVEAAAKQLGCVLHVARGADARKMKAEIGRESENIEDELCILRPAREALRELNARVEFVGLRMEESRRRRKLIGHRGPIIASTTWGCGLAWPMRYWNGADVFAYLEEYSLPVHPAYLIEMGTPREQRRVSWAFDSSRENYGDGEFLRRYSPTLFRELRSEGIIG